MPNVFDEFCQTSIDFLEGARVPYLIIGGLAVAAVGEPRMTADVDVVAFVSMEAAERLIEQATASGFHVAGDELERLHATGTLRFRRGRFQLDVLLASLPFEESARKRARPTRLFGRVVPMPTAEDLLLFKVIAGRDKDLLDAAGIARRHRGKLDRAYLDSVINEVCDLAEDTRPRRSLEDALRKAGA